MRRNEVVNLDFHSIFAIYSTHNRVLYDCYIVECMTYNFQVNAILQ